VNLQVVLQDDLPKINKNIEQSFRALRESDCVTLAVGGDHSVSYPIIRGLLLNSGDDEELDLSSDAARAEFEERWYPPGQDRASGGDAQQEAGFAMIHFDAHTDTWDEAMCSKVLPSPPHPLPPSVCLPPQPNH
jgi:hypothetical protein